MMRSRTHAPKESPCSITRCKHETSTKNHRRGYGRASWPVLGSRINECWRDRCYCLRRRTGFRAIPRSGRTILLAQPISARPLVDWSKAASRYLSIGRIALIIARIAERLLISAVTPGLTNRGGIASASASVKSARTRKLFQYTPGGRRSGRVRELTFCNSMYRNF